MGWGGGGELEAGVAARSGRVGGFGGSLALLVELV